MIFLVECYEPDGSAAAPSRIAERAQVAVDELVREGAQLRFLRATLLPEEETCFLLYEAAFAELVARATRRAGIEGVRITEARESR